jgi:hypothetical protein
LLFDAFDVFQSDVQRTISLPSNRCGSGCALTGMPVAQHEKPDLLNHIDNYIHNTINDKMKCNKKEMIGGSGKMTHQIMKLAIEMAILICLFILLSTNQTKHIVSKIFKINLESEITIATIAIYGFLLTILFVILRKIVFMTLKL